MTRTIVDGGATHTLDVTDGNWFYMRTEEGLSVRSRFFTRKDWDDTLDCYAKRFPRMVAAFR